MHRGPVLALLAAHEPRAAPGAEAAALREILAFVRTHPDCLERHCAPGHLTGSAWIVSPCRRRVLLTHHRKLDRWLQLGGHADGDGDLLAVARREAAEESGLAGLRVVSPAIFDVDRHWIPERPAQPGHFHHDLRFLLEGDPAEPLRLTRESKALAWVELGAVAALNPEDSIARLVRKTPDSAGAAG
ncbi:MAG: NUDIX hydrolase [Verrucomicrobia bacterium]|nr:NUDIX hydrolase [Verrucomicrobiota bacterium]